MGWTFVFFNKSFIREDSCYFQWEREMEREILKTWPIWHSSVSWKCQKSLGFCYGTEQKQIFFKSWELWTENHLTQSLFFGKLQFFIFYFLPSYLFSFSCYVLITQEVTKGAAELREFIYTTDNIFKQTVNFKI